MASNNLIKKFYFLLIVTIIFSACTRIGTSEIGLGLLPSLDAVSTRDTILDVETQTVDRADSLRIFGSDQHILGSISNDPVFGTTKASMFFQLKPEYFPFYFPGSLDSLTVDSAVLILSYRGFYGDSTKPLTINVNRVSTASSFDITKYYASNYATAYNIQTAEALANPFLVDFKKINDSVLNRFEASVRQIRIKLSANTAKLLMKQFDSTNAYKSDSLLRESFKGFALTTNINSNLLLRISMTDTNTKLGMYFTASTGSALRDTGVRYFRFSLYNSADANFITRDRASSEVTKHLNTLSNDSLVYVQTSPGTMVKIKVPGLKNFANKIIHRAELIAEQVPNPAYISTIDAQMTPPAYLFLGAYDSSQKRLRNVPTDYIGTSSTDGMFRFGGNLQYKSIQGYDKVASYNFNVSRYVQGVVSRADSLFDFRIIAPVNDSILFVPPYPNNNQGGVDYLGTSQGNQPGIGRVRLGGGKHSKFRMRLHIYYSDL